MANRDEKDQVTDEVHSRSVGREILDAAAKEMGFAVNSIRQEVVEKGWFSERVTPAMMHEWNRDDAQEKGIAGPHDFSRDDLYGRDMESPDIEHEQDKDQDLDR
ncbi:MAG: hypothetical protein HEP70_18570 [Rhodobiaceae bacterium]|jgi:hypothetical protein|nr:hypothetical protein [Rhodobiaceae bacterium]